MNTENRQTMIDSSQLKDDQMSSYHSPIEVAHVMEAMTTRNRPVVTARQLSHIDTAQRTNEILTRLQISLNQNSFYVGRDSCHAS